MLTGVIDADVGMVEVWLAQQLPWALVQIMSGHSYDATVQSWDASVANAPT